MGKPYGKSSYEMTASGGVPAPPAICHVDNCGCKSTIIFTVAKNIMTGKQQVGAFGEFGDNSIPNAPRMNDGWQFVRFIARCTDCHTNDLIRAGKVSSGISISENTSHFLGG